MINYFSTPAKQNQWTQNLQNIKQKDGESVESYARRFNKLLRKAQGGQALDARYQVNYFINGLTPILVSQVVLGSSADLAFAIIHAKLVETGVKVALQSNLLTQTTPVPEVTIKTSSPAEVSLEALTKQMEQLSINYANLSNTMNNNKNKNRNYGTRPQVSFGNNNNRANLQCYNCGKMGHIARNCFAPKNKGSFQPPQPPRNRNNPITKSMNYMGMRKRKRKKNTMRMDILKKNIMMVMKQKLMFPLGNDLIMLLHLLVKEENNQNQEEKKI